MRAIVFMRVFPCYSTSFFRLAVSTTCSVVLCFALSQLSLAQPTDRSGDDQFQSSLHLFNTNVFANAAHGFRQFQNEYATHPRVPDAMYYEAESYLALGREDDAISLLRQFDKRYPHHPFAFGTRLSLGKYFFEAEDYDRAILTLEQVLERSPTAEQSALALYWMGESAHQLNRNREALSYFERVVQNFGATETAPRAAYAIAYSQVELGRYDEAAAAFERLNSQFSGSEFASNMGLALAEVYYEIDDFRRAAEEIMRRMPNLTGDARERAIFLLAESQNQNRNSEQAIVNYRHFTEGDPDRPYYERALYGLAWNYHYEGAYQWAADNFRSVWESGYRDLAAESIYYAGVNLRLAENARAAIDTFRDFVSRYPRHRLADHGWFELGVVLYEQRRWTEARDAFDSLVRNFGDSDVLGDALKHLGNTSIALGDFDGAHRAFDRAIALNAVSPELIGEIVFQKAWLNYRNRNYAESANQFMSLFSANSSADNASEALFWAAESNFQLAQYAQAERLFNRYLREYPGARHAEAAHYALGWAYFKQGDFRSAIPEFISFLSAYRDDTGTVPYRSDALLRLADSHFALKQYPDAVRSYSRMAVTGDDYAIYQIGQAYSNSGDAFEAISTFRQLIEDYPFSEWREESQYSLGYLYFLNQEYEQAVLEYQSLIDKYPLDPLAAKAQYGIGDSFFNAGNIDRSVKGYEQVLISYPDSPFVADAAAGIQFALMASGQDERADSIVDSLVVALAGTPAAEQLIFRQAEARYQSGQSGEAYSNFLTFIESASDRDLLAEAHFYAADILKIQGDEAPAASHYMLIVDDYPESSRVLESARILGHIQLSLGNAQDAEGFFRLMEDNAGDDVRYIALARYGLSLALRQQDRIDEAESLLREAVEDAPISDATFPAYLGLARIALARGETLEAERLFDLIASRSRDETGAEAVYLLGSYQIETGRLNAGIETLARMQALFAGYPEWLARSYLVQGQAFQLQGNIGQAMRLYELITSLYPESSVQEEASTRLNELQ